MVKIPTTFLPPASPLLKHSLTEINLIPCLILFILLLQPESSCWSEFRSAINVSLFLTINNQEFQSDFHFVVS